MRQPCRVQTMGPGWAQSGLVRHGIRGTGAVMLVLLSSLVAAVHQPEAYADQTVGSAGIQGEQLDVVTAEHQLPLALDRLAVARFGAAVAGDQGALASDQSTAIAGAGKANQATAVVASDAGALDAATTALAEADARLAADRSQLQAIAIGMYTGALTDPQPTSLRELEAEQTQIIDAGEVQVVAGLVDGHVHTDVATESTDLRRKEADINQLAAGRSLLVRAQAGAAAAAARVVKHEKALATDQASLGRANQRLDSEEASLASALASVAGPASTPPGQLSILGAAALTAPELAGWFQYQGYVDLTAAPIQQLAAWYIQAGQQEGVRGDVAFAQAVLETGGFSSPDAVDLSNFAGIGHCDTCAAGWAFPSPQGGVLGQVQLLRAFAQSGAGPAHAPPPVLPGLAPAGLSEAGRCPTIESLTGVWATDPSYGQEILDIYGQMLGYALATPSKS